MLSFRATRRLAVPLVTALLAALAIALVPTAPASAAAQGITGTVTGPGDTGLADIEVDFLAKVGAGWAYYNSTVTDASGTYGELLPVGTYRIAFSDTAGDHLPELYDDVTSFDDATDVAVTANTVTANIDAQLAAAGHIKGHVEAAGGDPIADAWVDLYSFDGTQWDYAPSWGFTDENGDYDVPVAAGTYRLEFNADGYHGEFFDDVSTVEAGTSVTVAAGATASGKDAVLDKAASLSGTVTLPSDAAPDDADRVVTVVDTSTDDVVGETWLDPEAETAPGSHTYPWSVGNLDAGSYRVEFAHQDGPSVSEAEFYDNHPESAGADSADPITLTSGEDRSDVDATLTTGGTISGTVVDDNGDPVSGCPVLAVDPNGDLSTRGGYTDAQGDFTVGGLTTADYGIVVGLAGSPAPCDSSEYYTNTNGDLSPYPVGTTNVAAAPGSDQAVGTLVYQGTVDTPAVANLTAPTIPAAAPVVGTPVTANPGTWNPADVTLSYQWRVNGGAIPGATSQSYTPPAGAVGLQLSVTVTASKNGYTSAFATSNQTAPVVGPSQAPDVQNFVPPAVVGLQRVGQVVSAYAGVWTDGATTTVQWVRNGVPVPGATGSTYLLGPADAGTYVQVRVTGTKGGAQWSQLSTPTDPVQLGVITLAGSPRLAGKLKVGKVLRAVVPSSTPAPTKVRYRWFRNGVPIKGAAAKAATYQLVGADRRKHLSVRITLVRAGYEKTVTIAKKRGRVH